ncbi:hypothetical protein JTB14_032226 [Gonioctena quinquepunctata]|nr:hypothetical protein JTB14_032226 [Gonioctena quinquepunctata]
MIIESIIPQKNPDIILFYNSTKPGVDALDKNCANYSTSRRSRRWLTTVFYCILNISGVNNRVLYQFTRHGKEISRYNYLKELGLALCYQHVHTRINNNFIPRKIRDRAADIFGIQFTYSQRAEETQGNKKRKRCGLCPPKKDRKTSYVCRACEKPMSQMLLYRKPSALSDENHPDWVPSQHMGHQSQVHSKRKSDVDRKLRADKRTKLSNEAWEPRDLCNDECVQGDEEQACQGIEEGCAHNVHVGHKTGAA